MTHAGWFAAGAAALAATQGWISLAVAIMAAAAALREVTR